MRLGVYWEDARKLAAERNVPRTGAAGFPLEAARNDLGTVET